MPIPGKSLRGSRSTRSRSTRSSPSSHREPHPGESAPVVTLVAAALLGTLLIGALGREARAVALDRPLHFSADRERWDRKRNRMDLQGHARVSQPGEILTADTIVVDQTARTLDAQGNCVYVTSDSVIYGDEMHFNLDTRTGTIVGGRVSNERFSLSGERINKLADNRYQTHWGEYSTCRDCPESWTILGRDVDMQFEGYAYMSDVTVKISDVPALWLPYIVVPMKTQRQSGLLFPKISGGSNKGFGFVLPFFWAINRSADMTVGVGDYTSRGPRVELEGRYSLSPRSGGTASFNFINDLSPNSLHVNADGSRSDFYDPNSVPQRWSLDVSQLQELPWKFEERLRIREVSDAGFPIDFPEDLDRMNSLTLESSLGFSYSSSDVAAFVAGRRFRNLFIPGSNPRDFDPATVQVYPSALVTTNDQFLFSTYVATGLSLGLTNFSRSSGPFDSDPLVDPAARGTEPLRGTDPIREGTRVSLVPSIYTTLRPLDTLSLVPSARYFHYFYGFNGQLPNYHRGYLLLQAELSTQLQRIFDLPNPNVPRRKHLIRPVLTYSLIPYTVGDCDPDQQARGACTPHPFRQQISNAARNNITGYNFDDFDITPLGTNPTQSYTSYFTPLGHSLTYGFTTQVIDRHGAIDNPNAAYVTPIEFSAGQTVDFRELSLPRTAAGDQVIDPTTTGGPRDPQPFSRFYSNLKLNFPDRLVSDTLHYYYPYARGFKNQITTSAGYVLDRAVHQRVLAFERSLNVAYTWNRVGCLAEEARCDQNPGATSSLSFGVNYSLSDYLMPAMSVAYDFLTYRWQGAGLSLAFQSPSRCWKFTFNANYNPSPGWSWRLPDLSVNLTGAGFGGLTEVSSQAMSTQR